MMNLFFASLNNSGAQAPIIEDIFDGIFNNSSVDYVLIADNTRSPFSTYEFNYSGVDITVNAYSDNNIYEEFYIYVNDVLFTTQTVTATPTDYNYTLPVGSKNVKVIESQTKLIGQTVAQTYITSITLDSTKYTKNNNPTITDRMLFLGDSITAGSKATAPQDECFSRLFLKNDGIDSIIMAAGSNTLNNMASTAQYLTNTLNGITDSFNGATGFKKIVIALGTNDWSQGTSGATFQGWYEDLLDDINLLDNTIDVFCISPIYRIGEDAAMTAIRDAVQAACVGRAYATFIDGSNAVSQVNYDGDGIHPNTVGHLEYYNNIKSIINQ